MVYIKFGSFNGMDPILLAYNVDTDFQSTHNVLHQIFQNQIARYSFAIASY